jgi:thiol:disulfide interchange protein DsbD
MRSLNSWALALLAFSSAGAATAQSQVLTVVPPARLTVKRAEPLTAKLQLQLRSGYHVNSNKPSDEYMIPLRLMWDAAGPLEAREVIFPKPHQEKSEFAEKPLSVFSGEFEIATKLAVRPNAPSGLGILNGKLRYQACNDKMCLPPKTLDVKITYEIK